MGALDTIFKVDKDVKSHRQSGCETSNKSLKQGEALTLFEVSGQGIIHHLFVSHSRAEESVLLRRNLILRMYWDGEENPSVESPLGDFFGQGFGEHYDYQSMPMMATPSDGDGLVCNFPMPFSQNARITVENQSTADVTMSWAVEYSECSVPPDAGRFHASWRRQYTDTALGKCGENEWASLSDIHPINCGDENNYVFADIKGHGHFVGINYYVENPSPMWYGEGDDMWCIDGEPWPFSIHGTGTEDFFNSSWCPTDHYVHPYYGYPKLPFQHFGWIGRTHCYRFFIEDPVYFDKSLRASIEHGHGNSLSLDICSVAYWYQAEPHMAYPELPDNAGRELRPVIESNEVIRWRDSWLREMRANGAEGTLWGTEPFPEKLKAALGRLPEVSEKTGD